MTATESQAAARSGTDGRRPIRRALVSVFDKAGLLDLATGLHAAGVEIVSTGSTAGRIADAGVPVTRVEEVTGFPECLDGRVKTLHPRVHAGLLADTRLPTHTEALESLDIAPFDLLVVNLYPFTATVASGASPDDCVEQIDIGGPAMIRAAAKNHESVAVVTDPTRYAWVLEQAAEGGVPLADRRALAAEAFRHTASYDVAVASWMGNVLAPDGRWFAVPGLGGHHRPAPRRAPLRREPAPGRRALRRPGEHLGHRRRDAAARQGDVVQQLRRHRRRLARRARPRRGAAWRSSSTPTRAGSRSAPTSPRCTGRPTPATRPARSAGSSPPTPRSRRPWPRRSRRSSPR